VKGRDINEGAVMQGLQTIFFIGASVYLSFQAIRLKHPLLIMLVPALPLGMWLLGNPSALFLLMLLIQQAKIALPGLPGGLTLAHAFQFTLICWGLVYTAISGRRIQKMDAAGVLMALFIANIVFTMVMRGAGMRSMGGGVYGGSIYIYLLIGLLFYFVAPLMIINKKQVNVIFYGGLLCSIIPFLVQMSVFFSGGATYYLANFIDASLEIIGQAIQAGEEAGNVRWSETANLGRALMALALVVPSVRRHKAASGVLLGISLLLALASGFRGRFIAMAAVLFMWLVYESKDRKHTLVVLMFLAVCAWGITLAALPFLPKTFQRAMSFLPLAGHVISGTAALQEAGSSVDFRLGVWEMAWNNAPKYLLIGRGLASDITGYAWLQSEWYGSAEFFYHMHSYHSGPLSLLLDFGIFGFVLATAFMWAVCVKAWRGVSQYCRGRNDLISRYYAYLTIYLTYSVLCFFLIFGNVVQSFVTIAGSAVLLEALRRQMAIEGEGRGAAPKAANHTGCEGLMRKGRYRAVETGTQH
jgi:hypothetical protein